MKTLLPAAISLALPLTLCAETPQPLFFFDFNSPGKVEANKGSDPGNLVFRSSDRQEADLHGPAGSGLTGAPTDLALDNSTATAMGKEGVGGLAAVKSAQLTAQSFTVTGWIKTEGDKPVGDGSRLVEIVSPAGGFFIFGNPADGTLATIINGNGSSSEQEAYAATGSWIFFAVSYDSDTHTIVYYIGSPAEGVTEAGSKNVPAGSLADVKAQLMLLNSGNFERPFKGWMDNFRLFASENDSSAALSLDQLEAIRQQDLGKK
ncbi:MAG: hypothetical protein BGO12_06360 [Verrucomicrobia bacterium 61-8]|nr:hypothetical protein [Verrucomicrobiota bacterium]OJV11953.1 MAG: hypothetical protein BGO12_06360 [Verrucomicrobia bacterium 61-8]